MVDAFHLVFTDEDKRAEVEADTFGFSIHYFLHKTLKLSPLVPSIGRKLIRLWSDQLIIVSLAMPLLDKVFAV